MKLLQQQYYKYVDLIVLIVLIIVKDKAKLQQFSTAGHVLLSFVPCPRADTLITTLLL